MTMTRHLCSRQCMRLLTAGFSQRVKRSIRSVLSNRDPASQIRQLKCGVSSAGSSSFSRQNFIQPRICLAQHCTSVKQQPSSRDRIAEPSHHCTDRGRSEYRHTVHRQITSFYMKTASQRFLRHAVDTDLIRRRPILISKLSHVDPRTSTVQFQTYGI